MSLPAASIRRPVTTLMFYVGVLLFGIISLKLLAQELFPPITYPQLSIVTPYENAAPEEIETLITKPIEEAVGGISGLRKVTSTSKEGLSLVVAEFGWNQNMDFASLSVREKIDLIKERLPRDAQEPVVVKFNPFELPVMSLSISSSKRTPIQLRELARKWFKDELEKVQGVASASISGGVEEQILVDVDQNKLRASGTSIVDVSGAIASANLNFPGGTIKESFYEYLVRTLGEFKHIDEIGQIPIKSMKPEEESENPYVQQKLENQPSNRLVYLRDVATITRTVKDRTSFSRFNGLENVTIAIQKQAQSNSLQIANAIRKKLKELQAQLPDDIHVDIIYDQSKFIKEALDGVKDAGIQGGFLSFLVLLIFLKEIRNSALVVTVIPITVLATCTLMYFMHISLNVISLGGISLGVGMLLDNAVVVIENVYRKFEEDKSQGIPKAAAVGTEEVVAPVMGITLTAAAVFLPIVFVTGLAGQFFKQLAWVVVVTHLISAAIAFTLLPMLLATVGAKSSHRKEEQPGPTRRSLLEHCVLGIEKILQIAYKPIAYVERIYAKILPAFLRHKWFYLFIILLLFLWSLFVLLSLDRVLLPKVDQGQFMVKVDLPVGSRVEFTNQISKKIEKFISKISEVKDIAVVVGSSKGESTKEVLERLGSHQSQVIVTLKEDRKRTTDEIVQEVRSYFELSHKSDIMPARLSYVLYDSAFKAGGDNDAPVVIEIKGPVLDELKKIALEVQDKVSQIPGIYGVTNSIAEPFPETKITINKDRASYYRLSVVNVALAANTAIKGTTASKFKEENKEIDIRVQIQEKDRNQFHKLGLLMIHTPLDLDVPLTDFVKFVRGKGPSEIKRISQERTVQVYAKIYKKDLKEMITSVQQILDQINISSRYSIKIAGESAEIKESFASLQFAFFLSFLLVYMIMAAQFESFWQPFLIMFCVPLSLIGVAMALVMSHTPISVVVILGIILLGGIVVSNGIILIDFINRLRDQGVGLVESALQASRIRLRPILMTAFTSVIGLAPLAFGIGAGSKLQAPMAITVMGGLLVSTFLTLVVVPALYVGTMEIASAFQEPKKVAVLNEPS